MRYASPALRRDMLRVGCNSSGRKIFKVFTKCAFSFTYILFFYIFYIGLYTLGLLSHKSLKVYDFFPCKHQKKLDWLQRILSYFPSRLWRNHWNSNKRPPPFPLPPPPPRQIEKVAMRNFPEDRVFFGVFYRNLASSRFVITIYCFVAK